MTPRLNAAEQEFRFHHDHVIGTSLDLVVISPTSSAAEAVEAAILDEIDRLSGILSTYDRGSEISRWNASPGSVTVSDELRDVLSAYQHWNQLTEGAISAEIGGLSELWKGSAGPPSPHDIAAVLAAKQPLNIDALGKAYVMDQALGAALRAAPGIWAILLNIGGDILVSGNRLWTLGVADPSNGRDNSPALTQLSWDPASRAAVATSGIYERGRAHILDPRTGYPSNAAAGATVIARDSVTANALATALCILPTSYGLRLVEETPDAHCLVIEPDGTQRRSSGFEQYERRRLVPVMATGWPSGFEVSIELTLKDVQDNSASRFGNRGGFGGRGPGRVRRPYVAVWAEDLNKKLVRNIAVWASKPRYYNELHNWWDRNSGNNNIYSMTRATRPPGRYRLAWDGLDDKGRPVPEGTYRICVETNREHGNYASAVGTLECSTKPAMAMLKETVEFEAVTVEYGPRRPTA